MEVIKFIGKRLSEVPEEENPLTLGENNLRKKEVLVVSKVPDPKFSGVLDGYTVIHVPLKGHIQIKGKFHEIKHALIFAYALANYTGEI